MRRVVLLGCVGAIVGCARPEAPPVEEAGLAAPAMISLADVAGRWTVRAMPETGDSVLVTYEFTATADTAGWTMTVGQNRPPMSTRVLAVAGDSIVTEVGPFESVLRPGVMVTTTSVSRLHEGRLVGTFVARYQTSGADSVLRGRIEGTRTP